MGCCGSRAKTVVNVTAKAADPIPVGSEGMTLIQYIGGNVGTMTFYGAVTSRRYKVKGTGAKFWIDDKDANTGLSSKPGFLEYQEHGKYIFILA